PLPTPTGVGVRVSTTQGEVPHVTRLALADLGIKPLPRGFSALRSLLSVERSALLITVPMMISAIIASH
ncbi:hypothetical protein, partial [Streptomyces brasiliensis]|uniref:hypothetical protein n=1 Tax=Streptomyces brasiliensis TaxID=1954 RepID=UPI001E588549